MYPIDDTSYNGFANWDTWNASLWLANDKYAYHIMRDAAAQSLSMSEFADIGQDIIEGIGNPDGIEYENVNWKEVREGFVEE